jgi:hypothetical protein
MNKVRQELYCHECQQYVQFDIDVSLNGKHIITCPNCGHEHCRVVTNGVITEERWESRNKLNFSPYSTLQNPQYSNIYLTTSVTSSIQSTYSTYANGNTSSANDAISAFAYASWLTFGTGNGFC